MRIPGYIKSEADPMFVIPSRLSRAGRVVTRAGRTTLPRRDKVTKICFFYRWKASPSVVNMLKIIVTMFITMLAMTRSEPPVNSYLPPRTETSGVNGGQADLSTQYGTPDFGNGGSVNRNGGATSFSGSGGSSAGNGPSKLYDTPIGGNARVNGLGQSRGNGFGDGQPSSSYSASNFGAFSERGGNVRPSSSYGVPIANENNGDGFRNSGNGGKPSTSYGVPSANGNIGDSFKNRGNGERPSTSYGVPSANGNIGDSFRNRENGERPSTSYGVPGANGNIGDSFRNRENGERPSSSYGVPSANGNIGDSFKNRGNGERPSTSYGVPGANGNHGGGSGRNNGNGRPSSSYGVPTNENANEKHLNGGNNGGKLSSSYETPNVPKTNGINGFGDTNGGLSTSYGPPNRNGHGNNGYPSESPTRNGQSFGNGNANGYPSGGSTNGRAGNFENGENFQNGGRGSAGYNENAQEESNEPTKYEFSYEVKDEKSGSNYGHTETRDGDRAQGEFNVLLPDGRKQIVEYEADQDGFKPQIRYEGEANTEGGYSSGKSNGNNGGYSSDRPDSKSGGFVDNSGFNGGGSNGYPNGGPAEGKSNGFNGGGGNGYPSGKSGGQSFGRDNENNLSGNIGGYFSNAPSNSIGENANRQNGNGGYQY